MSRIAEDFDGHAKAEPNLLEARETPRHEARTIGLANTRIGRDSTSEVHYTDLFAGNSAGVS